MKRSGVREAWRSYDRAVAAAERIGASNRAAGSLDPIVVQSQAIQDANTRVDEWRDYLVFFNRIYNKLAASRGVGSSKDWFDKEIYLRRNDDLLSYLMHARNALEHGVEPTEIVKIRRDPIKINLVSNGRVTQKFLFSPVWCLCVDVVDRGVTYNPPKLHLGLPMEQQTIDYLATKALPHAERLITAAEELL